MKNRTPMAMLNGLHLFIGADTYPQPVQIYGIKGEYEPQLWNSSSIERQASTIAFNINTNTFDRSQPYPNRYIIGARETSHSPANGATGEYGDVIYNGPYQAPTMANIGSLGNRTPATDEYPIAEMSQGNYPESIGPKYMLVSDGDITGDIRIYEMQADFGYDLIQGLITGLNTTAGPMRGAMNNADDKVIIPFRETAGGQDDALQIIDLAGRTVDNIGVEIGIADLDRDWDITQCRWSPDDLFIAMSGYRHNHLIWDVTNRVRILPDATVPDSWSVAWSPDQSLLAFGHNPQTTTNETVTIIETTTWTEVGKAVTHGGAAVGMIEFVDNDKIIAVTRGNNGKLSEIYLNADGSLDEVVDCPMGKFRARSCVGGFAIPVPLPYKIDGTITESLVAAEWRVTAYEADTGQMISETTIDTSTEGTAFQLLFEDNRMVNITVQTYQGEPWQANTVVAPGDLVLATDPLNVPYYFECDTGGTTGATEPTWNTSVGGQTGDGQVTWNRVERLIQPVTQGPLRPVLI